MHKKTGSCLFTYPLEKNTARAESRLEASNHCMSTPRKRGRAANDALAAPPKTTAEKKRKPEREAETPSKKRKITKVEPTKTVLENVGMCNTQTYLDS